MAQIGRGKLVTAAMKIRTRRLLVEAVGLFLQIRKTPQPTHRTASHQLNSKSSTVWQSTSCLEKHIVKALLAHSSSGVDLRRCRRQMSSKSTMASDLDHN